MHSQQLTSYTCIGPCTRRGPDDEPEKGSGLSLIAKGGEAVLLLFVFLLFPLRQVIVDYLDSTPLSQWHADRSCVSIPRIFDRTRIIDV